MKKWNSILTLFPFGVFLLTVLYGFSRIDINGQQEPIAYGVFYIRYGLMIVRGLYLFVYASLFTSLVLHARELRKKFYMYVGLWAFSMGSFFWLLFFFNQIVMPTFDATVGIFLLLLVQMTIFAVCTKSKV